MTFSQLMRRWNGEIAAAAKRFNIPEIWVRAVMQVESGGRTMMAEKQPIRSSAGAMGLMQLMPQTYADMRAQYGLGPNPDNPHDNIVAGTAYLKWLRGKYGYPQMFAAYNDGPGHLDQRLKSAGLLPLETRNYLVRVTGVVSGGHGSAGEVHQTERAACNDRYCGGEFHSCRVPGRVRGLRADGDHDWRQPSGRVRKPGEDALAHPRPRRRRIISKRIAAADSSHSAHQTPNPCAWKD